MFCSFVTEACRHASFTSPHDSFDPRTLAASLPFSKFRLCKPPPNANPVPGNNCYLSSLYLGKPFYSVESGGCSGATDVRDLNGGSVARDEINRGLPDCSGQTVDIFEPVRASLFRQKANHDIRAGELDSAN